MGADFYPRLTAVADDHKECNRLVNEQAEVGLLLAGPGVIATLTFAPLVIWLFYSSAFRAGRGNSALDLSGHDVARGQLADGLHAGRQGRTETLFLDRTV